MLRRIGLVSLTVLVFPLISPPSEANSSSNFRSIWSEQLEKDSQAIATGHFNDDHFIDTATVRRGSPNVSIYLGNALWPHKKAGEYAIGANPVSVAVGDFDGDGINDLVASSGTERVLRVFMGNGEGVGNGTFTPSDPFSYGFAPGPVAVGDFNDDQKLDLVVGNSEAQVYSILYGDGEGEFVTEDHPHYPAGGFVMDLVVEDLDRDGQDDVILLTTDYRKSSVGVHLWTAEGQFKDRQRLPLEERNCCIAWEDFDGNGRSELAVAGPSGVLFLTGRELRQGKAFDDPRRSTIEGVQVTGLAAGLRTGAAPPGLWILGGNGRLSVYRHVGQSTP